jgi:ATP-binding cassette subfamily B protein
MPSSLSLLRPYFAEKKAAVIIGLFSLILVDILQLIIPRVIKWAVDDITAMQAGSGQLAVYAGQIGLIAVFIGLFRYIWRNCLLGTSRRVEEGLRNTLFSHIQTLSAPFFDRTRTGDLMARASNDVQQVRMASGMGLVAFNDAIFLGSAAIGFMLAINVRLTLYVLIPMPLIVIGTRFFTKRLHSRYQKVQAAFSVMTEAVRERFAGIRLIKAYSLENRESQRFSSISDQYIETNVRLARATGAFFPMMLFLTNVSLAIVLFLGGRQTVLGSITPGDFVAFINYLGLLTWPMMAMGWVINLLQRGKASLDRIQEVLETEPDVRDPEQPARLPSNQPKIGFQAVSFRYPGDRHAVLQDIELDIPFGWTVGLVGPPGAGKTCLLNLIPRLYDLSSGSITFQNHDIRELSVRELRSLIAYVRQDPFLFAESVRENITFGSSVSDEQLARAIESAALTQTIDSLPHGLDTLIGERGVILSGGQKQRLALARALLLDRPVLLLDDPISQVDSETGQRIVANLQDQSRSRTTVIASHRLSALRGADIIVSLRSGRMAEAGSHQELMAAGGYYARTWRMQQMEEELYVS